MSYTVIITEEVAANIAVTTQNYPITIEYNATNISDGGSYGNANVAAYLASGTVSTLIETTGNIAANNIATSNNIYTTGLITATGNVTGAYILGNGSQLTGLPATYSNANVQAYLPTYSGNIGALTVTGALTGTSTVSAVGNITGGNLITTGVVYTPQVEATGDLDLNTSGKVNVNGNVRVGDNNQNTQIATHGTGDLILRTHEGDANQGSITIFDGANGNIALAPNGTGQVTAGTISASGNVTAAYHIGNGSALTNLTGANVTGTVANATYALTSNAATYSTIATFATTANAVAGANVSGTVANATYATSAGSATTATSATTAGTVTDAAQGNITSVGTLTSLSVSGNVIGGNVISLGTVTAAGNLQSTQQTIIGTANTGTTGNIVMSGKNIATDMIWSPDGGNAVTAATGRVVVGTGWNGNTAHSAQQQRLVVADSVTRSNTSTSVRGFASEQFVTLTGNVVQNNFRQQGLGGYVRVGGGSAANTVQSSGTTAGVPFMLAAGQFNLDVGNISPYNLGNTSASHATINGGVLTLAAGSYVGNAFGIYNLITSSGVTANVVGNIIGYSTSIGASGTTAPAGNVYAFYHPSTTNRYGPVTTSATQAAPQYYAFYNEDDHAQVRLGSLRTYNENRYSTATSGTVNIDKNNAQVQYIAPTGNVTIGDLQNFVTRTVTAYETDNQTDTVTLIIKQGATPYGITMPTGNASIKYASNVSTVGTTANSVTMISITGYYDGSANGYLVTISPEFV